MAVYIRSRKVGGRLYYSLVNGERVNGKVVQTTVAAMYIYPTVEEALAYYLKLSRKRGGDSEKRKWFKAQAIMLDWHLRHKAEDDRVDAEAAKRYPGIPLKDAREIYRYAKGWHSRGFYGHTEAPVIHPLRNKYPAEFATIAAEDAKRAARRGAEIRKEYMNTAEHAHEVLGVTRGSTVAEIKSAYWAKSKQWHPDTNPDPLAHAKMVEVNLAYEQLQREAI